MSLLRRLRAAVAAFQKPANYRDPIAARQSVEERAQLNQERQREAIVHLNDNARFVAIRTINTGEVPSLDDTRALVDGINELPLAMQVYAAMAVCRACPKLTHERLFQAIVADKRFAAACSALAYV